jgi:cyanophycin synthetase
MKQSCLYCGNNPVPHLIFWYNESLNILMTPIRQKVLYNFFARFIKQRNLGQKIALIFVGLGENLKFIGRQKDIKKCKVRRAQVLWEEAYKRGIEMSELLIFGKAFDTYIATYKIEGSKVKSIVFSGLPRPVGYSNRWLDLMDDKWLLKQVIQEHHLPVPAGAAVTRLSQAIEIFKQIQMPVIVKPRAGSRGRHSTTFIFNEDQLKAAYKIAKQLCYWVMVEQQLEGPVFRATVVNFELCGVLRGDPPQITGNGKSSIAELIKEKNLMSHPGVKDIHVDRQMEMFLSRQDLALTSVLGENVKIKLSEKIGVGYGGSSAEEYDICHPDTKLMFVEAAKILGDPIVGFDFIISDIAKSYKQQKCGFIEVNSLPFINLHHDPLLGQPRNVAARVWDMIGWKVRS